MYFIIRFAINLINGVGLWTLDFLDPLGKQNTFEKKIEVLMFVGFKE